MSSFEYNNLLFEISQRLEELNVLDRLLFIWRRTLAPDSEENIENVLSLLSVLEEQNHLGIDHLEFMKELLKGVEETHPEVTSLLGKVKKFESKRKNYKGLLEKIIRVLDEHNDVERLVAMCREKIPEERDGQIQDVRTLFKELEKQNNLGIDRLGILKEILSETEQNDLLKEVEEFEEQRNYENNFEWLKAQAAATVSSFKNWLKGVLNIKTVLVLTMGGVTAFSVKKILSSCSTFDQWDKAFTMCVLPAGTHLVKLTDGCVCFTVRAETLSALTALWKLYQDGTLETRLYDFFVTDEVRERAGGEEVKVNVTIEEQEYEKACLELIKEAQEAATSGDEKRIRRNSDSAMYLRRKEEIPLLFKRAKTEWEARSRGEMAWKAHKAGEMDPGKLASVQKYLEDAQETRSMTTETSDSDYWTRTTDSELGIEETSDASPVFPEHQEYDGIRNPYVLIINNANFYRLPLPRRDAINDRELVRRFVKEAGFRSVVEHFDLRRIDMMHVLETALESVEPNNHDSFICIIMSYGSAAHILGADGRAIGIQDIIAMFRSDMCPQLRNKPKLFFLGAGIAELDEWQFYNYCFEYGDPRHYGMHLTLPHDADLLIAYSSRKNAFHGRYLEGAWSGPSHGPSFIFWLMQVLRANSNKEDLMTMLTRVSKAMSEDESMQMLCQLSTLTKKVYFRNFNS